MGKKRDIMNLGVVNLDIKIGHVAHIFTQKFQIGAGLLVDMTFKGEVYAMDINLGAISI